MSRTKKRRESKPPEDLALLLAFLNTRANQDQSESWNDPEALAR